MQQEAGRKRTTMLQVLAVVLPCQHKQLSHQPANFAGVLLCLWGAVGCKVAAVQLQHMLGTLCALTEVARPLIDGLRPLWHCLPQYEALALRLV